MKHVSNKSSVGRPLLLISFLVLEIFIILFFLNDYRQNDNWHRKQLTNFLDAVYHGATTGYKQTTEMIFKDEVNKPEVLRLVASALEDEKNRDTYRKELYRLMLPSYEKQKTIGIWQVHFHLKDGTSLLRMHSPKKYGDNLFKRPAVEIVNTEQKQVTGYEVGYFADGYRFMYPIYFKGRHIGSVEFSIPSSSIIDYIEHILAGKYYFMIDRTTVDTITYEDWKKMNFKGSDLSDMFVTGMKNTDDATVSAVNQKLKNRISERLASMEQFVEKATVNGRNHLIVFLPIREVTGKPVAYLVQYLEDDYSAHQSMTAIFDVSLFTLLLVGIFYSIDHIQSNRKALSEKNIELEQIALKLGNQHKILYSISAIQSSYIESFTSRDIFNRILNEILSLTDSEYGFIGEIKYKTDRSPYLKTYAITNIAWNEETKSFYDKYAATGMEFYNLNTLFGTCIKTGEAVIANDPENDPRRGGLPHGHPPLKSFLGLPIRWGNKMIGMVGIANRPGGYEHSIMDYLDAFLKTSANIIVAYESGILRLAAEESLEQYKLLSHHTRDIILFISIDGQIIEANQSAEQAYGYTREEMLSLHITDLRNSHEIHLVEEQLKQANEHGILFETIHRRRDGSTFPVEVSSIGIDIGSRRVILSIIRDITERKKSMDLIFRSEEKYRNLFESATDAIFILDLNGNFIDANRIAYTRLGYTKKELLSMHISSLDPPEFAIMVPERLAKIREQGAAVFESAHIRKDGTVMPVEVNCLIMEYEGREVYLSFIRDISERKHVEDKLRKNEMRLRESQEVAKIGSWSWDTVNNILEWSDEAFRRFDKDPETFTPTVEYFVGLIHPEDKAAVQKAIQDTLENNAPYHIQSRIKNETGREWVLEGVGKVERDDTGKPLRFVGTVQDITERKKAENLIQESEKKYRMLFTTVSVGWAYHKIIVDENERPVDYIFLEVNDAFETLTGMEREKILGKRVTEIFPNISNEQSEWITKYGDVALTGKSIHFRSYSEAIRKWFSVSASSPDKYYFITVFEDITQQMTYEDEVVALNSKLISKNRELEQILFATSHDLKTPLVNIHGFTKEMKYSLNELSAILDTEHLHRDIKKKIYGIINEDIPESMKFINTSVVKMNGLLESLLKLSRLGRSELNMEELNMNSLMAGVLQSFEFHLKQRNIKLTLSQLPPCRGDANQIPQIFSNLIGNALKHLEPSRKGLITISGYTKDGHAVYCVEDNGIGIAPEHHKKIFEMFYQLRPGEGEGMGLSIVKKIIELHKGRIWLESELGKGSRFYVSLPA